MNTNSKLIFITIKLLIIYFLITSYLDKVEYFPNDLNEYTIENSTQALVFFSGEDENTLGFDTRIIFKNIYNRSIKIDNITLTKCYEKSYGLSYVINKDGSKNITQINKSNIINFNKKYQTNSFFKTKINGYKKFDLKIGYKSLLDLELASTYLNFSEYICNFNLEEKGKILFSINSTLISTNRNTANYIYLNNINKI